MGFEAPSPCYCDFVRELQRVRDNVFERRGNRADEAGRRLDAVISQMLQDGCPLSGVEDCAEQCPLIAEAPSNGGYASCSVMVEGLAQSGTKAVRLAR